MATDVVSINLVLDEVNIKLKDLVIILFVKKSVDFDVYGVVFN